MAVSGSVGRQPNGTATGLDNMVPVWGKLLVLVVALEKKDSQQSPKHITHYTRPGTGKAFPVVKTASLTPCRAEMPPAGWFPKEKREGKNRTIYLSKNRSTLFVANRPDKPCKKEGKIRCEFGVA